MGELREYGIQPVTQNILAESLGQYKSPKDKICSLERSGQIIRLKNGLYVVSKEVTNQNLSLELIANRLYGPSYISFESALWRYGLIPERVVVTKSASFNRGKSYNTPLGSFDFIKVPENYFSVGLVHIQHQEEYSFVIAAPEKALCDLILTTRGLRIQSAKAMREYLFEDLRLDFDAHPEWDLSILRECIDTGYKRSTLRYLLKVIENA